MSKGIYVGVDNKARKVKNIYVGVDDKARKVKAAYVGVGGVARQVWPTSRIPDPGYTELEWCFPGQAVLDAQVFYNTRIVMDFEVPTDITSSDFDDGIIRAYFYTNDTDYRMDGYEVWYGGSNTSNGYFKFIDCYTYTEAATSNIQEGLIKGNRYIFDLNNNNNFYIYSKVGYYSVSGNNLVTTINIRNREPSQRDYVHFGDNIDGAPIHLYDLKIYRGSSLVGDYVPCKRISDDKMGLYNLISRIFFPNYT